jgi:hypothetical protein
MNKISQLSVKTIFLIDSMGALLSAIMLGLVLPMFEDIFGMPSNVLYVLSGIVSLLFVYSFTCFAIKPSSPTAALKIIGVVNICYCVLSIALIIYFYRQLTVLGLTYFILEKMIVLFLASVELKKAKLISR